MEGGDGGHEEETRSRSYSTSISSAGTIVSTAYTSSTSRRSSSSMSMGAAMLLDLEIHGEEDVACCREGADKKDTEFVRPIKRSRTETREKDKMMQLFEDFFAAPPASANCGGGGGYMSVLERWFTELGVDWVLNLPAHGAFAGRREIKLIPEAGSWIRGLAAITKTTYLMASLFPDRSRVGLPSKEGPAESDSRNKASSIPGPFQFAQFIQKIMFRMLPFVDAIVAFNTSSILEWELQLKVNCKNLRTLLAVRDALSSSLATIRLSFHFPLHPKVSSIHDEIVSLLSAKQDKAGEAIRRTMEQISTRVLEVGSDSLGTPPTPPQVSSDIHRAIRPVVSYIQFLESHSSSLHPFLFNSGSSELSSLISKMWSCLEQKLAKKSESFQDQSLSSLFLLNNSNFIKQRLHNTQYLQDQVKSLSDGIRGYMDSYLQLSWTPVLSCLLNPTPTCFFGRNYSPLSKFESEFQKIYATQKQWKVPDPQARKMLREAIIEKIIPSFTKYYIEDNNVTTLKFTPQELEEMLQELFEG